ncbi:MAG: hypothetical protein JSR17_12450 [Proteobacteria bacterium]|nr:hypothetical protein [Pseudomonadota bacterium]
MTGQGPRRSERLANKQARLQAQNEEELVSANEEASSLHEQNAEQDSSEQEHLEGIPFFDVSNLAALPSLGVSPFNGAPFLFGDHPAPMPPQGNIMEALLPQLLNGLSYLNVLLNNPSLIRVGAGALFGTFSGLLKGFLESTTDEVKRNNSVKVINEWARLFNPEIPMLTAEMISANADKFIDMALTVFIKSLKDEEFIKYVEDETETNIFIASMRQTLQKQSLNDPMLEIAGLMLGNETVKDVIAKFMVSLAAISAPMDGLIKAIYNSNEMNALLNSLDLRKFAHAIQSDPVVLENFGRFLNVVSDVYNRLINDPAIVEVLAKRYGDNREYLKTIFSSFSQNPVVVNEHDKMILDLMRRTHANELPTIQPFNTFLVNILRNFMNSRLFDSILSNQNTCDDFRKFVISSSQREHFKQLKQISPEFSACIDELVAKVERHAPAAVVLSVASAPAAIPAAATSSTTPQGVMPTDVDDVFRAQPNFLPIARHLASSNDSQSTTSVGKRPSSEEVKKDYKLAKR